MDYDLAVIGGGAGGLSAARAGSRRGLSTVLVTDGPVGGDCTYSGCVPSKTFIEGARRGLDFANVMNRVRSVVVRIGALEDTNALMDEGVMVMEGTARFVASRCVVVGRERVHARRMVIATGSAPVVPDIEGLRSAPFLTNETFFDLLVQPTSLAVLGAGPVGCELAQACRRFGMTVTVIDAEDRLLPREEAETSACLAAVFRHEGIELRLGARVVKVVPRGPHSIELQLSDGTTVTHERLLVAAGRQPISEGLQTEAVGISLGPSGEIVINDHLRTSSAGVFAVGDVTGTMPYTHVADEMGRIAVANAFSPRGRRRLRISSIPWVTFTDPEVARVGMTEAEAADHGALVAYLSMTEVDRAVVSGRTAGFVKLLAGSRPMLRGIGGGRILGATVVAERAGEMIHEPALAMRSGMFTGRLAQTVHAYPTWSLAIRQAASQFFPATGATPARSAQREGS